MGEIDQAALISLGLAGTIVVIALARTERFMRIFDGRLVLGGGMEVDGGLQCLSGGLLFGTRGVGVYSVAPCSIWFERRS